MSSVSIKIGVCDCIPIADGGVLTEDLDTLCAGSNRFCANSIKNASALSKKITFSELPKVEMAAK